MLKIHSDFDFKVPDSSSVCSLSFLSGIENKDSLSTRCWWWSLWIIPAVSHPGSQKGRDPSSRVKESGLALHLYVELWRPVSSVGIALQRHFSTLVSLPRKKILIKQIVSIWFVNIYKRIHLQHGFSVQSVNLILAFLFNRFARW